MVYCSLVNVRPERSGVSFRKIRNEVTIFFKTPPSFLFIKKNEGGVMVFKYRFAHKKIHHVGHQSTKNGDRTARK
jgi:hypothetical protein